MDSPSKSTAILRLPPWLRVRLPRERSFSETGDLVRDLGLRTVCQGANCPNKFECFERGVATFLILGGSCTRNCAFCNIGPGKTTPPDPDEPANISEAVSRLGLKHAVVTSVTRDDLPDGGAGHFAAVLHRLHADHPGLPVEVLIPDFRGNADALALVLAAGPAILNHNVETVPDLYPVIRPQAGYAQSLEVLRRVKELAVGVRSKSGLMVGLGETDEQVRQVILDLRDVGCDIVTIGQYMRPSLKHIAVKRYVHPDVFEAYAAFGREAGIGVMHCAPLVRSSYNAAKFM